MVQWPNGARAALSLSFDDARASQLVHGFPALDALDLTATFYVTVRAMQQNLDAWKGARDRGHEIGNHTMTHPCSGNYEWARKNALEDYTLDRITADINEADDAIYDLLGMRSTTFAYPCGQKFVGRGETLQSYVPLIAKRFKIGRGFNDTTPNAPAFFDPAQTLGVDMDMKSLEDLRGQLETTLAQNAWLVLVGHDFGETRSRQTTLLSTIEALHRYCDEQRIWIDTVDAVASHVLKGREDCC